MLPLEPSRNTAHSPHLAESLRTFLRDPDSKPKSLEARIDFLDRCFIGRHPAKSELDPSLTELHARAEQEKLAAVALLLDWTAPRKGVPPSSLNDRALLKQLPVRFQKIIKAMVAVGGDASSRHVGATSTVINLIKAASCYTESSQAVFRDLFHVIKRLERLKLPPDFLELNDDLARRLDGFHQDTASVRHGRKQYQQWTVEHEVLCHLASLIAMPRREPLDPRLKETKERGGQSRSYPKGGAPREEGYAHSLVVLEIFFAFLRIGSERAKSDEQRTSLEKHAAIVLDAALQGKGEFILRYGVAAEVPLKGTKVAPAPEEMLELVKDLSQRAFESHAGVLRSLSPSMILDVSKYLGRYPRAEEILLCDQLCERYSSNVLSKSHLLAVSMRALQVLPPLNEEKPEFRETVEAAIALSIAVVEVPLRLWFDSEGHRLKEPDRVREQHAQALNIMEEFLAGGRSEGAPASYELGKEIVACVKSYPDEQRIRTRLTLTLRMLVPFRALFATNEEFYKQVRLYVNDPRLSESHLREMPIVLRRFDPKYRGASAKKVFFQIKSAEQLESVIADCLSATGLRPDEATRTLRVMAELLEVLYRLEPNRAKQSPAKATAHVLDYMLNCGLEALPLCFVAYSALKRGDPLDQTLGRWAKEQIERGTDLKQIFYLVAPLQLEDGAQDRHRTAIDMFLRNPTLLPSSGTQTFAAQVTRSNRYSELYGIELEKLERKVKELDAKEPWRGFAAWMRQKQREVLKDAEVLEAFNGTRLTERDPLGTELLYHFFSILHREYSWNERKTWPSIGHSSVTASVQQLSRLTLGLARVQFQEGSTDKIGFAGELLPLPQLVMEKKLSLGMEAPLAKLRALDHVRLITLLEGSVIFARELGRENFVSFWNRFWQNQISISDDQRKRLRGVENGSSPHAWLKAMYPVLPAELPAHVRPMVLIALCSTVEERFMPQGIERLGQPGVSPSERAALLVELSHRVAVPFGEQPSYTDKKQRYLAALAELAFQRSELIQILAERGLVPATRATNGIDRSTFAGSSFRLGMIFSRNLAQSLLGQIGETCATRLLSEVVHGASLGVDLQKHNMASLVYLDMSSSSDRPFVQGACGVLAVHNEHGEPCLLVRGMNPRPGLLGRIAIQDLYEETVAALAYFAQSVRPWVEFKHIIAPDERMVGISLSNRPEVVLYQAEAYKNHARVGLRDPAAEALFNRQRIEVPCVVLRTFHEAQGTIPTT